MPEKNSTIHFFLFRGIHEVLKAESVLKSKGAIFELVPVPRVLSSDCGVCIALQRPSPAILALLLSLNFDRCFFFDGKKYSQVHEDTLGCSENHEAEMKS